jgi:hypothetical protein
VKEWKKIFYKDGKQKRAGGAIHVSDKMVFMSKIVERNKEHCIMIS